MRVDTATLHTAFPGDRDESGAQDSNSRVLHLRSLHKKKMSSRLCFPRIDSGLQRTDSESVRAPEAAEATCPLPIERAGEK